MIGSIEGFRALWWTVLLRGLLGIGFGLIALTWPAITLLAFVVAFGIYALADGLTALISAAWPRQYYSHRGLLALEGLVSLIAGFVTFRWPGITALSLVLIIAAWALITGMFKLARAFARSEASGNRWLLGLSGALYVALSIVLVGAPVSGALAMVFVIGIFSLVAGVILFALSFTLRHTEIVAEEQTLRAA
jgi:uncharacterized membrane protein HdeD (DUF308 family)